MGLLDRLDPMQRQILIIGAPVVAVFALGAMRKPAAAPAADAAAAGSSGGTAGGGGALTTGWTMPSTDAIGVGQLSDFESTITGYLNDLAVQVGTTSDLVANAPAPTTTVIYQPLPASPPETAPAPPPPPPPPAPSTYCPNIPGDTMAQIQASGESILGQLNDPVAGGCWWFGSLGGVFAEGGARFLGSARNYGFSKGGREVANYYHLGNGYRIVSKWGENYDFPG